MAAVTVAFRGPPLVTLAVLVLGLIAIVLIALSGYRHEKRRVQQTSAPGANPEGW